ncbi:MAG: hypothetical protein MUP11_01720, partial [Anaerolineales bacterium]|nr:hypothetical protein [Anaerolineales bacterium]
DPTPGLAGADICMHASLGPIRGSQTTGSMIASLKAGNPLVFTTGTAAPCTGIFKPVWVDAPPEIGQEPTSVFDPETLFWSHERLHREVILNFADRAEVFIKDRDLLEGEFINGALALKDSSPEERKVFSEACFKKAAAAQGEWLDKVRQVPAKKVFFHGIAWRGFNKAAKF